jgi:hypothetical protein
MPLKRERAISVNYNRHPEAPYRAVEQIPSFWPAATHELLVCRLRDIFLYVKVDAARNYVPDEEKRNTSSCEGRRLMCTIRDPERNIAEGCPRPPKSPALREQAVEIDGWESFDGFELGLGRGPRPLHRRHLLRNETSNSLLFGQKRKRKFETQQPVPLNRRLPNPPITYGGKQTFLVLSVKPQYQVLGAQQPSYGAQPREVIAEGDGFVMIDEER